MEECGCAECIEYGGPNPRVMSLRFMVLAAQYTVALFGLLRERSWKSLAALLGGLGLFLTIPRYLLCARCGNYGENCRSFNLGKMTSMYLPKVEGKEPRALGAVFEILALLLVSNAPAVGLRHNRKLLALYILLASATLWLQMRYACLHCVEYGTGWKRNCPGARVTRGIFGCRVAQF